MLWERCGWTCPRFLRATRRADRAHPIRLSKDLRPGVQKSTILHRSGRRPTTLNLWVRALVGQGRPAPPQRRTWLSRDCLESVGLPPDGAFCDVIGTRRFDFRESSFVLSRRRFYSKKAIACSSRHRRKQTTASRAEIISNANKRNSVVAKPNRRRHSTSETMLCNAPFRLEVFRSTARARR
jgi:hypothetical protein